MSKKRKKKREKFTKKEEKKTIGIKPIHIVGILILGAILFSQFGGSGAEKAEEVAPAAPSSGKTQSSKDPNSLYIPISKINDGEAHFYKYPSSTGKTIRFFVLKSSDGIYRAAFDACDVCYREGKGYRQDGDIMICNNCGRKFPSVRINVEQGGCNPAPLERHMGDSEHKPVPLSSGVEGGYLVIKKSDIETGARYF